MSESLSRRDFMKAGIYFVGGLIGAAVGLPSVAYLIDPALQAGAMGLPFEPISIRYMRCCPACTIVVGKLAGRCPGASSKCSPLAEP